MSEGKGRALSHVYRTAMNRQDSARLSDRALSQVDDEGENSPRGSIDGDREKFVYSDEKKNKKNKIHDELS